MSNSGLKSLNGFQNIDSVYGSVIIIDNDSIESLEGLNQIEYIGNQLTIHSKSVELPSFADLKFVRAIDLNIDDIATFHSFPNISYLEELKIRSNSLINFEGFESLENLGSLTVEECTLLQSMEGLSTVKTMEKLSVIRSNTLTHFNDLENCEIINEIVIHDNPKLESISALNNIIPDSITRIVITNNGSLTN